MKKKIVKFDHEDANALCRKRQNKYTDCCFQCPLKRDGECKAYLFKERDRIDSIINDIFGNETYEEEITENR